MNYDAEIFYVGTLDDNGVVEWLRKNYPKYTWHPPDSKKEFSRWEVDDPISSVRSTIEADILSRKSKLCDRALSAYGACRMAGYELITSDRWDPSLFATNSFNISTFFSEYNFNNKLQDLSSHQARQLWDEYKKRDNYDTPIPSLELLTFGFDVELERSSEDFLRLLSQLSNRWWFSQRFLESYRPYAGGTDERHPFGLFSTLIWKRIINFYLDGPAIFGSFNWRGLSRLNIHNLVGFLETRLDEIYPESLNDPDENLKKIQIQRDFSERQLRLFGGGNPPIDLTELYTDFPINDIPKLFESIKTLHRNVEKEIDNLANGKEPPNLYYAEFPLGFNILLSLYNVLGNSVYRFNSTIYSNEGEETLLDLMLYFSLASTEQMIGLHYYHSKFIDDPEFEKTYHLDKEMMLVKLDHYLEDNDFISFSKDDALELPIAGKIQKFSRLAKGKGLPFTIIDLLKRNFKLFNSDIGRHFLKAIFEDRYHDYEAEFFESFKPDTYPFGISTMKDNWDKT
jgi:hypothetical protein